MHVAESYSSAHDSPIPNEKRELRKLLRMLSGLEDPTTNKLDFEDPYSFAFFYLDFVWDRRMIRPELFSDA